MAEHEHELSLHETLASGAGGEVTDRVVRANTNHPLWLLKPLPLPVHVVQPRTFRLSDMCLDIVSANFDAFRPGDLRLPPLLFRKLMARVNLDRRYSAETTDRSRPDEGTVWAFMVVHDAEGAAAWAPSHTVALPSGNTLHNLAASTTRTEDREHPLIELPRIFKELNPGYRLLTTLTLDGTTDGSVNDAGIQALRWADNLTVLWIRNNSAITDDGIRMLAASLELPDGWEDGRGPWRLRALYLPGCRRVGDRSMRALARWPGLSVLDVRDTSCTEAALVVLNCASAALFDEQPPFQRCTEGLKELFLATHDPDEVLDNLAATLIKPDLPAEPKDEAGVKDEEEEEEKRRYLALHVVPGAMPAPEHLHEALRPAWSAELSASHRGHFVSGGTGVVWGRSAENVNDKASEKRRHAVQWALNYQAHDDAVDRARAGGRSAPQSWWEKEREEARRTRQEFLGGVRRVHGDGAARNTPHVAGRVYYPKKREEEVFDREVRGMPDLMMVRLVNPRWETMAYKRAEAVQATTVRRTAAGRNEVADLLVSVDTEFTPSQSQGPSQDQSIPEKNCSPPPESASQDTQRKRSWITRAPPASLPPPSQGSQRRNPFAAKPAARTSSGLVKLANTPSSSQVDPLTFIDKPKGHVKSDPLAFVDKAKSRGKKDPLAFVDKNKKDPLAFLGKGKGKGKADPFAFVDRNKSSSRGKEKMPDAPASVGGDDEVEYDDEYSDDNAVPNTMPGSPPARKKPLNFANTPRSSGPAPLRKENSSASTGAGRLSKVAKPTPNPTKNLATSSSPATPTASTPSSKKRQAPAAGAAGAPPKRKLTDFFARK